MPEDISVYARGSELGSYQAPGPDPIIVTKDRTELVAAVGIVLGLVLSYLMIRGSRALIDIIAPDIGTDKDDFLTKEFSAQLGVSGGALAGMPVKYKWLPRVNSRFRRPGHPASIDAEFTVANPSGARLRVHKEGMFNAPLGSLPEKIQPPPLLESYGYVLRLEPPDALSPEALTALDAAAKKLCAAELYDASLEGGKFSFSVIRRQTYEIEESREILEAGAAIASLFN